MTSPPAWHWQPEHLAAELEDTGYDVDLRAGTLADGGGSLVARRDRQARSQLVAIDAGGRFRATVTIVVEESRRAAEIGGNPVRVTTETRRIINVAGLLSTPELLPALLEFVDSIDAW